MATRRPTPAVYRRRRVMVLGIAILVFASAFWGAKALTADEPKAKPTPSPSPTVATPTEQAAAGNVPVTTLSGTEECPAESIRITPYVPAKQTNGGEVDIELLMTTASKKPCTFKPDANDILVIISEGDTPIYDSTVCKESLVEEPVALSPTWSTIVHTAWSGRGSGRGCGKDVGFATPGRFRLQIGALGGEPGETVFELAQKPKPPKPTCATPSPKEGDEPSGEPKSGQTACKTPSPSPTPKKTD